LTGTAPTPVQTSSFTIADNAFPSTPVSVVESQIVLLTLNSTSTVLKSIAMAPGFTEYVVNSISGCTADGVTVNPAGTVCSINIAFTPSSIGSQHNATLMATTIESGLTVPYAFGLTGQSTGTIAALTPGIIQGYLSSNGTHGGPNPLSGMNGPAIDANVGFFGGFALDSAHNMYVSDTDFGVIYKVNPQGIVNIYGAAGSQRPLLLLALDSTGNLYVDDTGGLVKIDAATNISTSVLSANSICSGALDSYGDGCPPNQVVYNGANGMVFGTDGNLYFSTVFGIHEWNFKTNQVTLYAGSVSAKGTGINGGPALGAAMSPSAIAFDSNGNLLFIDNSVQVREINKLNGTISTVAGASGTLQLSGGVSISCTNGAVDTAQFHSAGNGGPATAATFCVLTGLAVDPANNIYVVDMSASEIRRIDSSTGIIVEVSGQNSVLGIESGDSTTNRPLPGQDGSARDASLLSPMNVLVDGSANVYVMSETGNVRMINVSESALDFTPYFSTNPPYNRESVGIGSFTGPQQVTVVNAGNTGTVSFNPPFTSGSLFGISTADYVRDTATADCISTNAVLTPGTECPINIDFTPTVGGSPILDTETVNDTGGTQTITLIGYASGQIGTSVSLTPGLLSFSGAVGAATPAQIFTLTNNMQVPISISSITLVGVNPNAFMAPSNCGTALGANSSCQISVTFTAPALGNFLAQVSVAYTQTIQGINGPIILPGSLVGNVVGLGGMPEGQFELDVSYSNPGSFGTQNVGTTSSVHLFPFMSTGNVPLLISAVTLTGTNANQFAIASNNCPASLVPNATCTIGVTFKPTSDSPSGPNSTTTPFTAMLNVADNAPDTPQQTPITGTGIGAAPAVLNIMESISTTDTVPTPAVAMQLNIMESISTTDGVPTPAVAAQLNIMESITTSDAPAVHPPTATVTTLTGPSTAYPGQVLSLASMTAAKGTALNIFGTVSFYDNGVLLGSPSITGDNGNSAWSYSTTVQGMHNITAVYQGNAQFAPSTSNVLTITVAQFATQTTLTGSSTAYPGQVLSLASMTAATGTALNIFGPVTFYDNGVSLGSKSITDGNGDSGWSYSTTVQGVHNLTAVYQGSTQFAPSTSNSLTLTVAVLPQTITFSRIPTVPLAVHALTMTAHSTSGLHVTYAVTGSATVSGSTITLTGTGSVTVTASQSGNTEFAPATSVVRSFTVTP